MQRLEVQRTDDGSATLFVPALDPDVAYARTDKGDFEITIYPTPWKANRFE